MGNETYTLNHLAIIMDGNRRWAKKRGLPVVMGHRKGAETLEQVCRDAQGLGIKALTLYAFSTENWQRGAEEVKDLMNLLREYLKNDLKEIQKNKVKIVFIGERSMLDADIVESMKRIEAQTADNKEFTLCLAVSYGSRQEIINAARQAAKLVKSGAIEVNDIDEQLLSNMMYTKGIHNPDMLVRTSGEKRISNYLLWQIAYSELYFSDTLWPDFGKKDLEKIIEEFNKRERRYGKK